MNDLEETVRQIVAENLKMAADDVAFDMSVGDVPQWGSMAQMAIVAALQCRFGVKIPMEDLFDLTTVGDLVAEIEKLMHK